MLYDLSRLAFSLEQQISFGIFYIGKSSPFKRNNHSDLKNIFKKAGYP